ncbi:MAG: DNA-binding protein WhiA [Firmicutes bacterium]|nr:DNA-binding protein WhiA [Bacillota bacterium]
MAGKITTFSQKVKNELCRTRPLFPCCIRAELGAIIHLRGYITLNERKPMLNIRLDSNALTRYVFKTIKETVHTAPGVMHYEREKCAGSYFVIRILDEDVLERLFSSLGIKKQGRWPGMPCVDPQMTRNGCCRGSYLRGAFMAGGSINSPRAAYHLEIFSEYEIYARGMLELMQKFKITASLRRREKGYYVYLKNAESILDFLRIIRAYSPLMQMEEQRVFKSLRNHTNRLVNCETANLSKVVKASCKQIEAIGAIARSTGLDRLPPGLREAAILRIEHPEASLKELGEMMNPPLSKSGMSYRLKRLNRMADHISGREDRSC